MSLFGAAEEQGARSDVTWDVTWDANGDASWNQVVKEIILCQGVFSLGNKEQWKTYRECEIIDFKWVNKTCSLVLKRTGCLSFGRICYIIL